MDEKKRNGGMAPASGPDACELSDEALDNVAGGANEGDDEWIGYEVVRRDYRGWKCPQCGDGDEQEYAGRGHHTFLVWCNICRVYHLTYPSYG